MARNPLARRGRRRTWAPVPPTRLPPGRIVTVDERGEMLVRDSGGDGQPVLLLHGWMVTADLNWIACYEALARAGYRVLAIDHRGHGRGLRPDARFTLSDCADDAAALLAALGVDPVVAVGYSMGGPIAELLARDHPERVRGLVACATPAAWDTPRMRWSWRLMGLLRLHLTLFPRQAWRWGLRSMGFPDSQATSWTAAELSRGSGRDIAEAGREMGRYDARPWLASLAAPASVVVTLRDSLVPPRLQYELARLLSAPTFEVDIDHAGIVAKLDEFNGQLLAAIASTLERSRGAAAAPARAAG